MVQSFGDSEQRSVLEGLWNEHRDFLKRLLISLGRDVDLAEDLLQETFVRASSGFAGYRGGDGRAWLAAIAKNAFYTHARRSYVKRETELLPESIPDSPCEIGDLAALDVRNAVSALPPAMKTALIMRHYGGYSYDEIARRVGCPVGTAKSRVCLALKRLRSALATEWEEAGTMLCEQITDRLLMDHVLGKASDAKAIKEHMAACNSCSMRANEVRRVLHALDAVEAPHKASTIVEFEPDGTWVEDISMSALLPLDEPMTTFEFGAGPVSTPTYVSVQGEVVVAEPTGEISDDGSAKYRAELPRPVNPGDRLDLLFVNRPKECKIERLPDGSLRFGPGKVNYTEDLAYALSVRLPPGAKLVKATPEPELTQENGAVTVYWQGVLPANQQWEFWVDYRLAA